MTLKENTVNIFEKKSQPMDLSSPNGYNNKFSYNLSFGVEYLLSKNQRISAQAKGSFVQSKDSTCITSRKTIPGK